MKVCQVEGPMAGESMRGKKQRDVVGVLEAKRDGRV